MIPPGAYTFVATILIGDYYLSSNPVLITVASPSAFTAS